MSCRRVLEKVVIYGVATWGAATLPTGIHDWVAAANGHTHRNFGIHIDTQNFIQNYLTPAEREIVLSPNRDLATVHQIASIIGTKLHGNYTRSYEVLPRPRLASDYINTGMCRHDACAGAGYLNDLGIRAVEATVTFQGKIEGHTFIYLPDYNLAVEPTWDSAAIVGHVYSMDLYEQLLAQQGGARDYSEEGMPARIFNIFFAGLTR